MSMTLTNKEVFWLNDPSILIDTSQIVQILPLPDLSMTNKLNAVTRLVLLFAIVGYTYSRSMKILASAAVALVAIIIIYNTQVKKDMKDLLKKSIREGFANKDDFVDILSSSYQQPSKNNPYMNVLMTDYKYNKNRDAAAPSYNKNIKKDIDEKVKMIPGDLSEKLFNNLGDNLSFEHMSRNFYSMPNTQIPNNKEGFAKFCYGDMKSCKEGDGCMKNMRRVGQIQY